MENDNRWKQLPDDYQPYGFELTFNEESFEEWWQEVENLAEANHITTEYCEEEFLLDGELHHVYLKFPDDDYRGADDRDCNDKE